MNKLSTECCEGTRPFDTENGDTQLSTDLEISMRTDRGTAKQKGFEKRCSRIVTSWKTQVFTKTDRSGEMTGPL